MSLQVLHTVSVWLRISNRAAALASSVKKGVWILLASLYLAEPRTGLSL